MDVFLLPIGPDKYELYYEPPDDDPAIVDEPKAEGFFRKWMHRFREMLREAEQARLAAAPAEPAGALARGRRRMMRFVAERIAEWRLLWHLRSADAVVVHVPTDMTEEEAMRRIRAMLKADADRHLRSLIINLLLLAASIPLMVVPGPNVLAYYFSFHVVGHFLARQGARRGLNVLSWRIVPTPALCELRKALALKEPHRAQTVHHVASELRLQHLVGFFQRIALPTA